MNLTNLKILPRYDSKANDVIREFYIPVLSNATNYDRVSAYFDSKILSLYAKGLEAIYENKGKIRFIFSHQLTEEDYENMRMGYENKSKIEEQLTDNINKDLTIEEKMRLSNLAFLIENGVVDIKIAFTKKGIFHDKFGLVYCEDKHLYFRGSNNETVAAIQTNYEAFEVSCDWHKQEYENIKIREAIKNFNQIWDNEVDELLVLDIPIVVKNELLKFNNGQMYPEINIMFLDCIALDLDDNKNMIISDMLINGYNINNDWTFKNFIKKHITEFRGEKKFVISNINYILAEKIINHFLDLGRKNNIEIKITQKLKNYINVNNLEIEKRRKLGIDIKEKSEYLKDNFEDFCEIVNKEIKRKLRDKQLWDAFHIVSMWKAANFSVPGSGKTSTVYGAFAYLNSAEVNKVDKIIMIGPLNSFLAWKEEFVLNFSEKKQLKLLDIREENKNTKKIISELRFDSHNKNLILINYDMLSSLEEVLNEIIDERTMLVFDEVHKIKAINGKRATSALNICKNAKYKVVLTGTPIPNSYQDIYNMLNVLYTDEYKMFFRYSPSHLSNPSGFTIKDVNEKLYPFYCRTTKKDLEIPTPNPDSLIEIKMNNKEIELFDLIYKKYSRNIFTLYIRLLQASTNPELLLENITLDEVNKLFRQDNEDDDISFYGISNQINNDISFSLEEINLIKSTPLTGKALAGIELIKKLVEEEKQVLVWGIFINTINKIEMELKHEKIKCKIITGNVSLYDREKIIDEFKNGDIQVLITNPHTLAESISLHKTCHDAVYFEYSFNLTHMLQSRDRINRLGLNENQYTQYYYLMLRNDDFSNDTIDWKVYNRLKEKEQIMLEAIEGTTLHRMDFDDIDDIKKILDKN